MMDRKFRSAWFAMAATLLVSLASAEPLSREEVVARVTSAGADLSNLEAPGADLGSADEV